MTSRTCFLFWIDLVFTSPSLLLSSNFCVHRSVMNSCDARLSTISTQSMCVRACVSGARVKNVFWIPHLFGNVSGIRRTQQYGVVFYEKHAAVASVDATRSTIYIYEMYFYCIQRVLQSTLFIWRQARAYRERRVRGAWTAIATAAAAVFFSCLYRIVNMLKPWRTTHAPHKCQLLCCHTVDRTSCLRT